MMARVISSQSIRRGRVRKVVATRANEVALVSLNLTLIPNSASVLFA